MVIFSAALPGAIVHIGRTIEQRTINVTTASSVTQCNSDLPRIFFALAKWTLQLASTLNDRRRLLD
jgi:flavin reductase (DIM6/NTAB) family NADH-FMN oxidoreductase RutF